LTVISSGLVSDEQAAVDSARLAATSRRMERMESTVRA
jgi:hypothetical protein